MKPINQITASTLQSAVRAALSLDAEASSKLSSLNGKVVHINISDLNLDYYFRIEQAAIEVSADRIEEVQASISGELPAYLAAIADEHSEDSLFKGSLKFSGEIAIAKQFQNFAQSLNIDWQEPLAQALGDPIAHTITTGLSKLSRWFKSSALSARQDISEYLQEESQSTPSESEQQWFFSQVDNTRSRADRLNARISKIASELSPMTNHKKQ
jgi:ubiquinone biosynthesis protein UbiJ